MMFWTQHVPPKRDGLVSQRTEIIFYYDEGERSENVYAKIYIGTMRNIKTSRPNTS
jgi:hypothetical protein